MQIKDFNRRPSKGTMRKLVRLQKNIDLALKQTPESMGASPVDEALARALDSVFPPRETTQEGWQNVAKFGLLCATTVACIALFFWGLK